MLIGNIKLQELSPFANINESEFPVISKILNNATFRKMYVAHMKTIMSDYFENGFYRTRAREIQAIIDSDVQKDANKFFTYSDFINNIDYSTGGGVPPGQGTQSVIGIVELMEARTTYLNSLSDFQASSPTISDIEISPSTPSPNEDVWITAYISNAESAQLAYRRNLNDAFEKIEMMDDGNNGDGAVNDGIYGVSVPTGSSGFQYYIYTENVGAASFAPARAAYEFFTVTVSGDLVINEFMASNENIVNDSDGEYEDWIELYNNSESDIELNGFFLSDDGDNLAQWVFPDTNISPGGYLIIWADKDEDQQGLHASFKLSSSGETIYLSNSDTTIIDEVSYSDQITNLSTGRYPNGTGSFVQMTSSFGLINTDGTTSIENLQSEIPSSFFLKQNFPNPFNPSTQITVGIPESGNYNLRVYNVLGQEVAILLNDKINAGTHSFYFNAFGLTSGIYFYSLTGKNISKTKKMVLLK